MLSFAEVVDVSPGEVRLLVPPGTKMLPGTEVAVEIESSERHAVIERSLELDDGRICLGLSWAD